MTGGRTAFRLQHPGIGLPIQKATTGCNPVRRQYGKVFKAVSALAITCDLSQKNPIGILHPKSCP
ncbi:hypothetical protein [Desulfobotulus sp.]|uniref:hypothetical protein n=1 Tax=Desulfobotulus sp. TaxID=1940337 RepID=UPI002A363C10|nr:hypothetical protein [Desulfobotulus sp.]MDY0164671.1 hypothetical protein [Desulfobotulus sp.]